MSALAYEWRPLFNLGLSRTGTTSLACALFAVGMKSVHDAIGTDGRNASLRIALPIPNVRAAHRREILVEWVKSLVDSTHPRHASVLASLRAYDAFGDNPFYGIDDTRSTLRERLAAVIPGARFVCTSRARETWIKSMTTRHPYAGGDYLAGLANTSKPFREPHKLGAFFERHDATECEGVPTLDLDACAQPRCTDAWGWLASVLADVHPNAATRAWKFYAAGSSWVNAESIGKLRRPNAVNTTGSGQACPFVL